MPRNEIIPYENQEQAAVMQWWAVQYPQKNILLFAIPNGGHRLKPVAAKLAREGVKAGVADLFLSFPMGGYHGFYIEMKRRKGGKQANAQKIFQDAVEKEGYLYFVAYGAAEAITKLQEYMRGELQINSGWRRPQPSKRMPLRIPPDKIPELGKYEVADGPEFIKASEAIRLLPVCHATLYNLLKTGQLRGIRMGNRWLVARESVIDYLREKVS